MLAHKIRKPKIWSPSSIALFHWELGNGPVSIKDDIVNLEFTIYAVVNITEPGKFMKLNPVGLNFNGSRFEFSLKNGTAYSNVPIENKCYNVIGHFNPDKLGGLIKLWINGEEQIPATQIGEISISSGEYEMNNVLETGLFLGNPSPALFHYLDRKRKLNG